jgi:hypothetical protein
MFFFVLFLDEKYQKSSAIRQLADSPALKKQRKSWQRVQGTMPL